MQRYYHYTSLKNIEKILKEGLKPGIEINYQSQYCGKLCDNKYVYLLKNFDVLKSDLFLEGILKQKEMGFLTVDVSPGYNIERDLDSHMLITTQGLFAGFQFCKILGALDVTDISGCENFLNDKNKEYYDLLVKKIEEGNKKGNDEENEGIKGMLLTIIATDKNAVQSILSKATDKKWDEVISFYRTSKSIPPKGKCKIERYYPQLV